MTESTLEGPADSIAGELANAFDGYGEDDGQDTDDLGGHEEVGAGDAGVSGVDVSGVDGSDDHGDGGDEDPDKLSGGGDGESEESGSTVTAPEHWSAADKELFESAPEEIRQWLLDRHKSMEGDYTRKTQEISDFRRSWEPVQEMYAPYMDQLHQAGLTPQQHIERLVNADLLLNTDPIQGIQHVAQMYGIDLSQIGEHHGAQQEVSPEVLELRNELNGLKGQIMSREQAQAQERHNAIVSEIETFAEAKDEQGQVAHPHFDEVIDDMMSLARAERAAGREPNLSDLYDKACWSNTSVRKKLLDAEKTAQQAKAEEEARAKAAKAKKASRSVSGSPSGQTPTDDLDLREQLERQLN